MFSNILFIVTGAVVAVTAQSSTVTSPAATGTTVPTISPCILACVQPAAAQNGCSFTDPSCICISAQFQADAGACIAEYCTAADAAAALALQTSQCGAAGLSATGSATPKDVSFTAPGSSAASGGATSTKIPASATPSASKATNTASASAASHTASAAASKTGHGAGALVGALLAGILAL